MNHKRKRPRIGAPVERRHCQFPRGIPAGWNIMYHVRPRRRVEVRLCHEVVMGADPDALLWPLGNHKPTEYFW